MRQDGWNHFAEGRLDRAEAIAHAALTADANDPAALHLRGLLAWRNGGTEAATADIALACDLLGEGVAAAAPLRDLCEMYRVQGRLDEARALGERAVTLNSGDVNAHYNLAIVQQDLGDLDAAIALLRHAIAIAPDHAGAHFELAEALLLRGDFAEGWSEYEWRFRVPGAAALMPHTASPMWAGEPMPSGRLLLVGDQGFGDVVQFMRYIPDARARCGELVIACSREVEPLVRQLAGGARLFQVWDEAPAFDRYAALSSLPRLFETTSASIPAPSRYVRADPTLSAAWRERLKVMTPAGFRRIGLVWAGRPTHGNDANRSMPLNALAPLSALERTQLVALQKGDAAAQVGHHFGAAPLLNLGPEIGDFGDTAAIISNLDVIVSVDTSVAHLAGALGQPTCVLLPFAPDWRWLRDRSDSPWYPSLRLYRQVRRGDWSDPVRRLAADLAARKR